MSVQLSPPWDSDKSALIAARVLEPGYREVRDLAVWCRCSTKSRRRLIRVFAGQGGRRVLLVPSYTLRGRTVPALAALAPTPGSEWAPLYAHCALCRKGIVLFYPDAEGDLRRRRAKRSSLYLVLQFGVPARNRPKAGEIYDYVEGDTWSDGPCDSWLLHVGSPTRGHVDAVTGTPMR